MTKFDIAIANSALTELKNINKRTASRILSSIKELEEDPFRTRPKADIKKLKGVSNPDMYRLRVGDFRIVYTIEKNSVKITHILQRSSVYKRLD